MNQSRHNLIESKARIIFPNKIRIKNRRIRNNPVAYERARWSNKNQEKRDKGSCERDLKRTIKARKKNPKKDCTLKDRVDVFYVSCQHTNKKQTNKRIKFAKASFYIRVNQSCLTEVTLSSIQKIMKATQCLALHSSKAIKSRYKQICFDFLFVVFARIPLRIIFAPDSSNPLVLILMRWIE